jgi:hypothetical protein
MGIEVTQQPFDFQMEVYDLQTDPSLSIKKWISRRFLENIVSWEASKFLPSNAVIICKHVCLWSCILHYERNKVKDEK